MNHVIIGASAAGIHCAKTLRDLDPKANITIISKDVYVYSRCMLHHLLSGHRDIEQLDFTENNFFENYQINWLKGIEVLSLQSEQKKLILSDNQEISFDTLLIATGASSFLPPIKNIKEAKGVYGLRNIDDVFQINEQIKTVKSAVVLGAGLVGVDAVIGLAEKGMQLSLIEMGNRILPLQLDSYAAASYEQRMKEKGVHIYTCVKVEEILLDPYKNVQGVLLNTGDYLPCQMVICAAGVTPNTSFISEDTLIINRGIQVNEKCQTNIDGIYAAGDVTGKHPIWPLAVKQGIVAAYNMVGKEKVMEDDLGLRNSMNFLGLNTVSIGMIVPEDESYSVEMLHDEKGYKKIIYKDSIIHGAIFQGDISYSGVFTYLIKNKIPIENIHKNLWDINFSDFFFIKEDGQFEYAR